MRQWVGGGPFDNKLRPNAAFGYVVGGDEERDENIRTAGPENTRNPVVTLRISVTQNVRLKDYAAYLSDLRNLLNSRGMTGDYTLQLEAAVNGQASLKLEALVHRTRLKRTGAFFSSPTLSQAVARNLKPDRKGLSVAAADPACGAGNLLIAAASKLPIKRSLSLTLRNWGARLAGFDLHPEFVEATRLRLALFARYCGARYDLPPRSRLAGYFPHIRVTDGIVGIKSLEKVDHLLLNPPFNQISAPHDCSWGKGKVSKAALFITRCIARVKPGTKLSAILPDVLRSGSRYRRWRQEIECSSLISSIEPIGNFQIADVDVFLLNLTAGGTPRGLATGVKWWSKTGTKCTIGEQFVVGVGAVVKHRVKRTHMKRPYLHAKGLPFWGELTTTAEMIRFDGPLVKPPFVVIRRTSSPSDRHRALATIVLGKTPLAVDNHLIVCKPRSGGVGACRSLIKALKSPATDERLNQRIRCRHLTVGVIRELPLPL